MMEMDDDIKAALDGHLYAGINGRPSAPYAAYSLLVGAIYLEHTGQRKAPEDEVVRIINFIRRELKDWVVW